MKTKFNILYALVIFMIVVIVVLASLGCAGLPTYYGQAIVVTRGEYINQRGKLLGDCSGFENYKVKLTYYNTVCIHSWDMRADD